MSVFSILLRDAVKAGTVAALVLGVAGCGVKSAPAQPSGDVYPRQYPATGEKTKIGTATKSKQESREDTGAPRSPLGFPLEYPNRSSY